MSYTAIVEGDSATPAFLNAIFTELDIEAAASSFTNSVTIAGILSVDDTTESTSTVTGSGHFDGGVGIAKDLVLGATSTIFIGDTADANVTTGVVINQAAADNAFFVGKSSDVAHGMTTIAEADTFAYLSKVDGAAGGLIVRGLRDADGVAGQALFLSGHLGEAADTTKSTSGIGVVHIQAAVESGTGVTVVGSDGNLLTITNNSTTRFIFDAEGSGHADVEFTTFDKHDDIAILDDMEALMIPNMFGEAIAHDAEFFAREGLINDIRVEPNGKTRGMLNMTKLAMLHTGALRQLGAMVKELQSEVKLLGA